MEGERIAKKRFACGEGHQAKVVLLIIDATGDQEVRSYKFYVNYSKVGTTVKYRIYKKMKITSDKLVIIISMCDQF